MGIIFQTSFDHYTTILQRFQSISSGSPSISNVGRNGSNGLLVPNAGLPFVKATLPSAVSTIYFAFGYRTDQLPSGADTRVIAAIYDVGTIQCQLVLRSDGTLDVQRGSTSLGVTSNFAMLSDVYYHIEWRVTVHPSTGVVEVWINENQRLNLTGQNTRMTANSQVNVIGIGSNQAGGAGNNHFDDLVVRDDQQIGDKEVGCYFVTAAGNSTQWTPSGAATNHEAIDEAAPDGDTTHNATVNVGDKDTFPHGAAGAGAEIDAVIPLYYAKKTDAGTAKFSPVIRHSGTDYTASEEAAPSEGSYEYHAPKVYDENPGTSAPWTATDFNNAEIGYERTA